MLGYFVILFSYRLLLRHIFETYPNFFSMGHPSQRLLR